MRTRTKRIAGLAAAAALLGGGIAGAFAATGGQDDRAADLATALSERTGEQVTAADVKGAFTDVLEDRLADEVAAGRITQAQADAMLERAKTSPLPGMGGREGHHGPGRGMGEVKAAVEKKLGMTHEQLHQAREHGKTLAQVAESKGVSKADLVATITDAIKKSERGSGLTDAQAKEMATHMVDGTGPRGGHGRGGHGPGGHMPPQGP